MNHQYHDVAYDPDCYKCWDELVSWLKMESSEGWKIEIMNLERSMGSW